MNCDSLGRTNEYKGGLEGSFVVDVRLLEKASRSFSRNNRAESLVDVFMVVCLLFMTSEWRVSFAHLVDETTVRFWRDRKKGETEPNRHTHTNGGAAPPTPSEVIPRNHVPHPMEGLDTHVVPSHVCIHLS